MILDISMPIVGRPSIGKIKPDWSNSRRRVDLEKLNSPYKKKFRIKHPKPPKMK